VASAQAMAERLKLYRQGLTDAEIARAQGVKPIAVRIWRHRLRLPPNRVHRWARYVAVRKGKIATTIIIPTWLLEGLGFDGDRLKLSIRRREGRAVLVLEEPNVTKPNKGGITPLYGYDGSLHYLRRW